MTTAIHTANTLSISDFVDRIGIELEGGWNRFSGTGDCNHSCDDDCTEHNCDHSCQQTDDCWDNDCQHDCLTSIECSPNTVTIGDDSVSITSHCEHECENSYSSSRRANPCFVRSCSHECDSDCYSSCSHSCEDSDYCCQTRIDGFRHDGSVNISGCEITGEAASPPCASWAAFENWITKWAPDKVNRSCGTHIHVSTLSPTDYDRLMGPAFYPYFKQCMTQWGEAHLQADNEFWDRLRGKNEYCCANDATSCGHGTNAHDSETQHATSRKGSCRYAHVNFCKQLHGTVEFRVFHGMKTPALIMSAAKALVACIDTFLVQSRAEDNKIDEQDINGLLGIVPSEALKLAQTVGFYAKRPANISWDMNLPADGYQDYTQDNLNVDTPKEAFKVSVKRFVKLCKDIAAINELEDSPSTQETNALNAARTVLAKAVAAGNTHAIITAASYRAIKRLEHGLRNVSSDDDENIVRVYWGETGLDTVLGRLSFKSRFYNMTNIVQNRWHGVTGIDREMLAFIEAQTDLIAGVSYGYGSDTRDKLTELNRIASMLDQAERRRRSFIRITKEQQQIMLETFQLTDLFMLEIFARKAKQELEAMQALQDEYAIETVLGRDSVIKLKDAWQRIANNENLDGRTINRLRRRIESSVQGFNEAAGHTIVRLPNRDCQSAVLEIFELAKKPKGRFSAALTAADEFLLVVQDGTTRTTAPLYVIQLRPDLYDTYQLDLAPDETIGSTAYGIRVLFRPAAIGFDITRNDTIQVLVSHLDIMRRSSPLSLEARSAWKMAITLIQVITNEPVSYIVARMKEQNQHLSFNVDAFTPPVLRSSINAANVSNPFIDMSNAGNIFQTPRMRRTTGL